jgi:isocitrate dehydrogenase
LYGDIVSDIASQVAGSVGLAGSMNIGTGCAMFEAVHGSAPDISGKGIANPSGLINAAVLMLYHVGQSECAAKIGNALLYTLESGQHTADIVKKGEKALSTMEFAEAVVKNLGKSPKNLTPFASGSGKPVKLPRAEDTTQSVRTKRLTGVDVFIDFDDSDAADLGKRLNQCGLSGLVLQSVSSRGMEMFNPKKPDVKPDVAAVTDLWACRFMGPEGDITNADIRSILHNIEAAGLEWVKIENLYTFDHVAGFSGKGAE